MTQTDKELLLKDLCARLPYKVVINATGPTFNINNILTDVHCGLDSYITVTNGMQYHIESIKPYLFPLSSMTIEQRCELHDLIHNLNVLAINNEMGDWVVSSSEIDWYNKNHFDYRDLIPMGLAIDATNLNIY